MQKVGTEFAEQSVKKAKFYVADGPMLWVSTLLHHKGALSANRIWEEHAKDN